MATGDEFYKKELKIQMKELEQRIAGLGQSKENKGQETCQKSLGKENVNKNF